MVYIKTFLFAATAVASTTVDAFSVSPQHVAATHNPMTAASSAISTTQLNYQEGDEADHLFVDYDMISPLQKPQTKNSVPTIELPRHSVDTYRAPTQMLDAEMLLGRTAMIGAILMIGTEVLTGASLPEQIVRMLY